MLIGDRSRPLTVVDVGVRRELDFQRAPHAPWQALLVEREAVDGEMRYLCKEYSLMVRMGNTYGSVGALC